MKRWPPDLVLEAVRATAQPVLRSIFRPDCCIGATRIGIDVLRRFGIQGRPMLTTTLAACRSFLEWQTDVTRPPPSDAYYLITDTQERPGALPGHLVITGKVADCTFLLDLSAAQMHRPAKRILVPEPIFIRLPDVWPADKCVKIPLEDGGALTYSHHPRKDITWDTSPDWVPVGEKRIVFESIVADITNMAMIKMLEPEIA